MSTIEDALFQAARPAAEALLAKHRREGNSVDARQIAELTLSDLRRVVEFDAHELSLRARLTAHLDELQR